MSDELPTKAEIRAMNDAMRAGDLRRGRAHKSLTTPRAAAWERLKAKLAEAATTGRLPALTVYEVQLMHVLLAQRGPGGRALRTADGTTALPVHAPTPPPRRRAVFFAVIRGVRVTVSRYTDSGRFVVIWRPAKSEPREREYFHRTERGAAIERAKAIARELRGKG